MRVCIYLEAKGLVAKSGFKTACEHQIKALKQAGVQVTTDPSQRYDILHLHFFGPRSMYWLKRAKSQGVKVVVHAHSMGAHDFRNSFTLSNVIAPWYERYLRFFYQMSDCIVTPSAYAKEVLEAQGVQTRIVVISNGVDRELFEFNTQKRSFYREKLGLHRFTIFSAGNVILRKGILDFIAVARELPQFDFVWFGHRWSKLLSFYPDMHKQIESRPKNLLMPGFMEDTVGAFSAGDVLFFPSYGENQPVVLLEAASIGVPLVVRDIPEYRGWLLHNKNCLKGKSNPEFISYLLRLAADQAFRERLSKGALELAEENSLEKIGRELKKLYHSLLNGSFVDE